MKRLLSWIAMATLAVGGLLFSTGSPVLAAFPADGYYKIVNARSGHCLDQSYAGGVERSQVGVYPCHGGANQTWYVANQGYPNYHQIRNLQSGKCLNQSYAGGVETRNVIAFRCGSGDNDDWGTLYTSNVGDSIANHESNKCLDQDYSNNTPHTGLLAFRCKGLAEMTSGTKTNQHWIFLRA